jgi:hypothetical protein
MTMIKKIISGGQADVEIASLDAAIRLDIPHGGWCYKGKKTDAGFLAEHCNVKEIDNPSYFERLEKNIIDSDGTIVFTWGQQAVGPKAVKDLADRHNKPLLNIHLKAHPLNHNVHLIRKWMVGHRLNTIYFTGTKMGKGRSRKIYNMVIQIIEDLSLMEWRRIQKI